MDKVKLEDLKCGRCGKIPKSGDNIYSCSECPGPNGSHYRCEACFLQVEDIHKHGSKVSKLKFVPILTKFLATYDFTPCDESQKRKYFCSNSKNGCQEEFLAKKAHEKSCIYQKVSCPSVNCHEVIAFKDVDDHMEQSHTMLKVNKEWNFEGTEKDLDKIICCLTSYDQKFFAQVDVLGNELYFKVIMLGHQVNAIPFNVNMTFSLEDGTNISMKDRVYPVIEHVGWSSPWACDDVRFSKVSLEKITEYFDAKSMEWKCQPKIDFCLKIVNEKMDEIAKDKNAAVESGVEDSDG